MKQSISTKYSGPGAWGSQTWNTHGVPSNSKARLSVREKLARLLPGKLGAVVVAGGGHKVGKVSRKTYGEWEESRKLSMGGG